MYLYFDSKGTLLETINDEAIRQYNVGVNTINVFIEDANAPDSGKIPWDIYSLLYRFQLADGTLVSTSDGSNVTIDYTVSRNNGDLKKKTIPFNINRDLKHFKYGKEYEFFVIDVPCGRISELADRQEQNTVNFVSEGDVFKRGGVVLMTIQAAKTGSRFLSLERVAFTVENAVMLPDEAVNSSEFNWLLQQYIIGDYLRPQLVYGVITDGTFYPELNTETITGITLTLSNFNREPKIGEKFLYLYTYLNSSFAVMATVVEINDDENTVIATFVKGTPVQLTGPQGKQGENGKSLVFYKETVSITGEISTGKTVDIDMNKLSSRLDIEDYATKDSVLLPFRNGYVDYLAFCTVRSYSYANRTATLVIQDYIRLTGTTGARGEKGAVFTPHVGADTGDLWWTNNGGLQNPATVNIRGPEGKQGPTGAKIVSTTLAYSSTTENRYQQTFDDGSVQFFSAPRGKKGATFTPSVSDSGILSWTNDVGLSNPAPKSVIGPQGPRGFVFTPSVSASGIISWANDGGLSNPASVNITGPQGRQGEKGENGSDALMCAGTVLSYYAPQSNYLMVSSFNRTPKVNENFLLLWNKRDSSSNAITDTYMCIAKVTRIEDSRVDFSVPYSYSIMGGTGATGAKGDTGIGITSARAQTVTITEQYTTTPIVFSLSDGSAIGPVNIQAKNGITPNCIAYIGTVEASAWISSSTYASYGYGYQAKIHKYDHSDLVYEFETYIPEVIPIDVADIMGTNFAPFAETRTDGLIIYAKEKPTTAKTFNITLTHTNSKS